ncbi:UPF0369 protein C6orf57 [Trichinella patagoniensis]|uniref:Succinate dehydrogenase assembly factor 4, mitochondrial n=2 Tax=Trichinella TaxID=6333 RepID=A0A0V0ZYH6_9BILA|nr:UPF0369 protein C6orf57 [Trichinella murrelli]KRX52114.1 UPF0369 protein C6orf57 [Trichinella sp. T9]KRY17704.1 UPF0369 protein C6orf57 [Trichinella patagoniensis]KRZ85430.1 UPF0369 protein C6orf57 [Trichinella sp. T8]
MSFTRRCCLAVSRQWNSFVNGVLKNNSLGVFGCFREELNLFCTIFRENGVEEKSAPQEQSQKVKPDVPLEKLLAPQKQTVVSRIPNWPDGVNPHTGEIGGPAGVEPTRFGDWERKGRVSDF